LARPGELHIDITADTSDLKRALEVGREFEQAIERVRRAVSPDSRTYQGRRIADADAYLDARTGSYIRRSGRYNAVAHVLKTCGRDNLFPTLFDLGAGFTELARCLYGGHGWQGRYVPVDAALDGCDLDEWTPPRDADWFVALEVIEHLSDPFGLLDRIIPHTTKGIILSTPNPATTDVLGMDPTHRTPVSMAQLFQAGWDVEARSFYGKPDDSLFATWPRGLRC
jgi:hypothetical protein